MTFANSSRVFSHVVSTTNSFMTLRLCPLSPTRSHLRPYSNPCQKPALVKLIQTKIVIRQPQPITCWMHQNSRVVTSVYFTNTRMSSSSTQNSTKVEENVPPNAATNRSGSEGDSQTNPPRANLSTKDKLKLAVRDYGATVMVFHITMSLMSLGFFCLLVYSGLDVIALIGKLGINTDFFQSKVTENASKFVIAYAVHKVFAPARIAVTLSVTPLIVRKLRSMGILKQSVKSKPKSS